MVKASVVQKSPRQFSHGVDSRNSYYIQGPPLGIDIMYLVLADRNMQVRFGLKVVWES